MPTDNFIGLPADQGAGKRLDTSEVTTGSGTVQRQRFVIADPDTAAAQADVTNASPALTDYGLVTRDPLLADLTTSGTIAALNGAVTLATPTSSAWAVQVSGTWVGTLAFEGTVNGADWTAVNTIQVGVGALYQGTTANGVYRGNVAGLVSVRVRASAWTSGTANVTIHASLGVGPVMLNAPLPSGTNVVGGAMISTPNEMLQNIYATVQPYGMLRTSPEPTTMFYDPFDGGSLDTTTRWNAAVNGGAGTVTLTSGRVQVTSGATSGGYGSIATRASFVAQVPGFLQFSFALALEYPRATTTHHRFWGIGTAPGTPTAAAPLTDAIGFETDGSGNIYGCVWQSGVRIHQTAALTVADNAQHRYIVQARTDRIFWFIDTLDAPVANTSWMVPNTQTLPVRFASVTGAAASVNLDVQGIAVADSGRNAQGIADGQYPWRKATVALTAPAQTDPGLVVRTLDTNRTASGALAALNAAVAISADGVGDIAYEIDAGTLVGTVIFEATLDDTTWFTVETITLDGRVQSTVNSFAARGHFTRTAFSQVRARVSAWTSGTTNARLEASTGGVVGINAPTTQRATYRAAVLRITPGSNLTANTPKAYLSLWHTAAITRTVKLRRVLLSFPNNTVATVLNADIIRITAAPTAGTAITMGQPDSSDAATTTSGVTLPTTDAATTGGLLAAQSYNVGVIAAATLPINMNPTMLYDFQEGGDQKPITIRAGVLEGISVRVTAVTASVPTATITVEFTEE